MTDQLHFVKIIKSRLYRLAYADEMPVESMNVTEFNYITSITHGLMASTPHP